MGLWEIHDLNLHGSLVEGDSLVVVGWGLGCFSRYWKHAQVIHEIIDLVRMLNIKLGHVPTSQNGLTDKLAKWGTGLGSIVRSNVIPQFLV